MMKQNIKKKKKKKNKRKEKKKNYGLRIQQTKIQQLTLTQ
jgi:hypothetical protein